MLRKGVCMGKHNSETVVPTTALCVGCCVSLCVLLSLYVRLVDASYVSVMSVEPVVMVVSLFLSSIPTIAKEIEKQQLQCKCLHGGIV